MYYIYQIQDSIHGQTDAGCHAQQSTFLLATLDVDLHRAVKTAQAIRAHGNDRAQIICKDDPSGRKAAALGSVVTAHHTKENWVQIVDAVQSGQAVIEVGYGSDLYYQVRSTLRLEGVVHYIDTENLAYQEGTLS